MESAAHPGGYLRRLPRRFPYWATFFVLSLVLFAKPLAELTAYALDHESYSHILLVPFIVGYLVFCKRSEIRSAVPVSSWPAVVALSCGVVVLAFANWMADGWPATDRLSLLILAFVLVQWGIFLQAFGTPAARKCIFGLVMLLFLVPLPQAMLEGLVAMLLWGSAWVTDALLRLSGVPFIREGYQFGLPGVNIEIAKECSGIRSSMALFITGLLAGHFFLRRGVSKAILIAALIPLAVFKNGLRIVTLTLLSVHVDPGFLSGDLHHKGGVVFFLITLGVMGLLLEILRRSESRRP